MKSKIACIGTGTIGTGWATLFSAKGYKVSLYDVKEEILKTAMKNTRLNLEFLAKNDFIDEEANKIMERINETTELSEALEDVDYVQESGPEDYDIKREIYREMDRLTPKDIILATSSSGLLMTKIQKATKNMDRCVTAHPWNPPHLLPLVEIVPGEKTSSETVNKTYEFMEELGKIPIRLKKEAPGHIANRLQIAVWREACSLVERGIADVSEVDKAMRGGPGLRWSFMGPNLTFHLGGGEGGIQHFFDHLSASQEEWWKDMDDWEKMPYNVAKKVIEGTKNLEMVKKHNFEELTEWRDERLVKLLKELYGKDNL